MPSVQSPMPNDRHHQVLYRLVGQIITNWSHAEWLLFMLFGVFAGCDINRARMVLAAHQSFRAKRELIERLGRAYLKVGAVDDFDRLMARVKHLSEKRNMVAHHRAYYLSKERVWRFMNDSDETQPNTFGRYQDVQTGNLRTWVREISQLRDELYDFIGAAMLAGGLRDQPREFGELARDRETLADLRQGADAKSRPPPPPSEG